MPPSVCHFMSPGFFFVFLLLFCLFFSYPPIESGTSLAVKASAVNPSADTLQEMSAAVENVVSTCSMSGYVSFDLRTVEQLDYSRKLLGSLRAYVVERETESEGEEEREREASRLPGFLFGCAGRDGASC